MSYTIRPFSETRAEYETLVDIHNAFWPDRPNIVEDWIFWDENRNRNFLQQRYVVEDPAAGNKIVGFGQAAESSWSYVAGKYGLEFYVHPDYAGHGIEQQLYDYMDGLLQEREPEPTIYDAMMREDKEEMVAFLKTLGFQMIQREAVSEIDLEGFDAAPFAHSVERAAQNGITIHTVSELMKTCPDWRKRNYDLFMAIIHDIPHPDDSTPQPMEEFYKFEEDPKYLPEAWFIALDGDEWVGNSSLWRLSAQPERLSVGVTGVLRSHRRKGIATALKLKTFQYAQQHGIRFIKTGNEENNPMYDLNVALGFKPQPGWLVFRKKL